MVFWKKNFYPLQLCIVFYSSLSLANPNIGFSRNKSSEWLRHLKSSQKRETAKFTGSPARGYGWMNSCHTVDDFHPKFGYGQLLEVTGQMKIRCTKLFALLWSQDGEWTVETSLFRGSNQLSCIGLCTRRTENICALKELRVGIKNQDPRISGLYFVSFTNSNLSR